MLTDEERLVVDILVGCGTVANLDDDPIHAVDQKMRWNSANTRTFVANLVSRKIIKPVYIARDGPNYNPGSYWEEVK